MLYNDLIEPLGVALFGRRWVSQLAVLAAVSERSLTYAIERKKKGDHKALENMAGDLLYAGLAEGARRSAALAEVSALWKDLDLGLAKMEIPPHWPQNNGGRFDWTAR